MIYFFVDEYFAVFIGNSSDIQQKTMEKKNKKYFLYKWIKYIIIAINYSLIMCINCIYSRCNGCKNIHTKIRKIKKNIYVIIDWCII